MVQLSPERIAFILFRITLHGTTKGTSST